jgi:RimJ/RimL family protein N-acetyltransferase
MTKRAFGVLKGGRVRLRPVEPADLDLTMAWRNQEHIRRWFLNPEPITPEQHRAWYEKYRERDDDFVFIIEEAEGDCRPVGQVSLYRIDWAGGRAEFGRLMIGERDAAGKGLAKAATELLVSHALELLGLGEVYLEVRADNAPALAIYRACGFEVVDQHAEVTAMKRTRKRNKA